MSTGKLPLICGLLVAASLCQATTITGPLYAGNLLFSDLSCGDAQVGFVDDSCLRGMTVTTGVVSTGQYAGESFLSFSDNGITYPFAIYYNAFLFIVSDPGFSPSGYQETLVGGEFLFGAPTIDFSVNAGHSGSLYPTYSTEFVSGSSFTSSIDFGTEASTVTGPETPESFTIYYQPVFAPEPSSLSLYCFSAGLVLVALSVRFVLTKFSSSF